jgi:hypothetical protein
LHPLLKRLTPATTFTLMVSVLCGARQTIPFRTVRTRNLAPANAKMRCANRRYANHVVWQAPGRNGEDAAGGRGARAA